MCSLWMLAAWVPVPSCRVPHHACGVQGRSRTAADLLRPEGQAALGCAFQLSHSHPALWAVSWDRMGLKQDS